MTKYIIRRLIQAVPTFFGITLLAYMLMALTPGGPIQALVFANPRMPPDQKEILAERLGVNDPLPIQYLRWLGNIVQGDFGNSFFNGRPVLKVLQEKIPATLELAVSSLLLGAVIGVVVGVLAAVNRGGIFDNFTRVMAVIFNSVPAFWLGLLLLLLFAVKLGWVPIGDRCETTISDSCGPILGRIQYMILPVFVLATGPIAGFSRFMRASMLEVVNQDYIRTARAKGLSDRRVWFRHGLRNALIPIATFLGPAITGLLGGAVIIERTFNYQGLGMRTFEAFIARDYPVVMAVTIYAALATIVGYLLSDILYSIIDPRIRY